MSYAWKTEEVHIVKRRKLFHASYFASPSMPPPPSPPPSMPPPMPPPPLLPPSMPPPPLPPPSMPPPSMPPPPLLLPSMPPPLLLPPSMPPPPLPPPTEDDELLQMTLSLVTAPPQLANVYSLSEQEEKHNIIHEKLVRAKINKNHMTSDDLVNAGFTQDEIDLCICMQSKTEFMRRYFQREKTKNSLQNTNAKTICVLISSNSLSLTKLLSQRVNNTPHKKNEMLQCKELSSAAYADWKTPSEMHNFFINTITRQEYNKLPDVITMCGHSTRLENFLDLLNRLSSLSTYANRACHIRFALFFDEADTTMKQSMRIIDHRQYGYHVQQKFIERLTFVTATPKPIFDRLKEANIDELENQRKNYVVNPEDFEDYYRNIIDNTWHFINDNTSKPLSYIEKVMSSPLWETNNDNNERRIVFAPAAVPVRTHNDVKHYFLSKGYNVLVINGIDKKIYMQDGHMIDLYTNKTRDVPIYDILKDFTNKHPQNFAITGYTCITRGLTFLTTGFSFTDFILCNYHMRNINELAQLAGRACGGKRYAGPCTVYSSELLFRNLQNYLQCLIKTQTTQTDYFNAGDFCIQRVTCAQLNYMYQLYDTEEEMDQDFFDFYSINHNARPFCELRQWFTDDDGIYVHRRKNRTHYCTPKNVSIANGTKNFRRFIMYPDTVAPGAHKYAIGFNASDIKKHLWDSPNYNIDGIIIRTIYHLTNGGTQTFTLDQWEAAKQCNFSHALKNAERLKNILFRVDGTTCAVTPLIKKLFMSNHKQVPPPILDKQVPPPVLERER